MTNHEAGPDISRVTERVWTGADLPWERGHSDVVEHIATIGRHGITHVVDCRMEWTDSDVYAEHAPTVSYLHHPQDDAGQRMPDAWFDKGTRWVGDALDVPGSQVLVHCHMGINRGPSLTYAVLLTQGIHHLEALDMIRDARPVAAIAYAEDACDWWLRRSGVGKAERTSAQREIAGWREERPIDVVRIIRTSRETRDLV